jgi:radical SAM protein with 4Fe4S-binding SPASM domain
MEVELGPGCSLHRPLGSAPRESAAGAELSEGEVRDVIRQGRDLGARRITILTGAATPEPDVRELIRFVRSQDLEVEVFEAISDIEWSRRGRAWASTPPPGRHGCMRHKFSCLLCSCGDVMPCVGLNTPIGNIREHTLSDIIKDSEVLEDLRDHIHTIKGPCASCADAEVCYGCRGAAHRLTGDYLASDPLCWKNTDRQDEIASLPFAADEIIPQKRPMRIIDDLVKTGDRSGVVSVTISEEMPFVGDDGVIDEAAYFEMMAQSIAAINGFKRLGRSQSPLEGFLVGVRKLEVLGPARVGDTLNIHVHKETRFGKFGILKGTVSCNDAVLARGEVKIWQDAGDVSQTAGAGE